MFCRLVTPRARCCYLWCRKTAWFLPLLYSDFGAGSRSIGDPKYLIAPGLSEQQVCEVLAGAKIGCPDPSMELRDQSAALNVRLRLLVCLPADTHTHAHTHTHVCMYVCMYVCMHGCMYVCMYACMYVCMYACMYVCMYVCMCIFIYIYIYICVYLCV